MKAHRRWDTNGKEFFVDDEGRVVTEFQARTMGIVESSSGSSILRESNRTVSKPANQPKSDKKRLKEAFQDLGLTKKQAKLAAKSKDRR